MAGDARHQTNQLARRPPGFRAIAVDLPGHGKTAKEACRTPSMASFAKTILKLYEILDLYSVVFVGHSMGCRIALECWAHALKTTVKGLVLLDGSSYKLRSSLFAFANNDPRSRSLTDEERAKKKGEAYQRMLSHRTPMEFQANTLAHIQILDKAYDGVLRQSHIDYDFQHLKTMLEAFGKSSTPFLNLQSTEVDAQNQRVPLEAGRQTTRWTEYLQRLVPQAEPVVVEDCGHFPHVVAAEMVRFVSEVQPDDAEAGEAYLSREPT